jgi:hypothetical protein
MDRTTIAFMYFYSIVPILVVLVGAACFNLKASFIFRDQDRSLLRPLAR